MSRHRLQRTDIDDYDDDDNNNNNNNEVLQNEHELLMGTEDDVNEDDDIEGEELITDNMEREYRPIPELDEYEASGIDDDSSFSELSVRQRAEVDADLARRDRQEAIERGDLRRGLIPDFFEEDESGSGFDQTQRRHRTAEGVIASQETHDSQFLEAVENLEDTKGMRVCDWVQVPQTRQEIKNRFGTFLRTYIDEEGRPVYSERITTMAQRNGRSLIMDYGHLVNSEQVLAYFVPESPKEMLEIFDEVATELTLARYPRYKHITNSIHVRIAHLPLIEDIRSLRKSHINQLVRVSGVVGSCSNVLPQLNLVYYNCVKCRCVAGPFYQTDEDKRVKPSSCPDCQSNGPFEINSERTIYRNYQRISLQETPGTVPAGRLPRSKEAILTDDLVNTCKPGDEVDITGIFCLQYDRRLNTEHGFPVLQTHIFVNNLMKTDEQLILQGLTDGDVELILKLSRDDRLFNRIVSSMAPSIYGLRAAKEAITFALFGAEPKLKAHRIRGDINVLLCGDPGTGKSQLLKFIEKLAPRCVYSTGQGASAVGLTAYLSRNTESKEFTLEAGALVLADKGVCLIDEFDKMNDQDRTSIHEAMEQQSISISKAGIVTTLQARTTIIAAANPIGGRYDPSRNFTDNVDLSSPILSRFDILCVLRDVVNPAEDEMMAQFIVNSHRISHPRIAAEQKQELKTKLGAGSNSGVDIIPMDLLRKYIIYAKQIKPRVNEKHGMKLTHFYTDLRRAAQEFGGVDITVRHSEALIRLAEAHARIHLRDTVTEDDCNMAIRTILESFISTEKFSVVRQLESQFKNYLRFRRTDDDLLLFLLKQLMNEQLSVLRADVRGLIPNVVEITEKSLVDRSRRMGISAQSVSAFLTGSSLTDAYLYHADRKVIVHNY